MVFWQNIKEKKKPNLATHNTCIAQNSRRQSHDTCQGLQATAPEGNDYIASLLRMQFIKITVTVIHTSVKKFAIC